MPQARLDIDFGAELLGWIEREAAATGQARGALVKDLILDARLQRDAIKPLIRQCVLDLGAAVEPDEQYDPAEDPRESQAVATLAALLGSYPAAEACAEALTILWTRWYLRQKGDEDASL